MTALEYAPCSGAAKGFLAVQSRLTGEPLEEYILPEGGGFFFALPGVPEEGRFLADGLFT